MIRDRADWDAVDPLPGAPKGVPGDVPAQEPDPEKVEANWEVVEGYIQRNRVTGKWRNTRPAPG